MALPAIQNVLGVYNGFYQSAVNMDDRAPIQMVITQQAHRRLRGTATIAAGIFPVEGTIAASGEFSVEGKSRRGTKLEGQGTTRFLGDGSVFVELRYRFKPPSPNRGGVNGLIGLLRDTGFPGAPGVVGAWDGTYESRTNPEDTGPLAVRVSSQETSRFDGEMTVNDLVFPFVGTIGAPMPGRTTNPCDIIGFGPAGWFLVMGELSMGDPATGILPFIEAHYQLFFADGSRDTGDFSLTQK